MDDSVIDRRDFAKLLGVLALAATGTTARGASPSPRFGPAFAFDHDALVAKAAAMAKAPYVPRAVVRPDVVARIDYDAHQGIKARSEVYPDAAEAVTPFHVGSMFPRPVRLHAWDGTTAREFLYRSSDFQMARENPARELPDDVGFAGFRVHDDADPTGPLDWIAFLGASYFRSSGDGKQYGISARGVAVDCAMPTPEEFPDFTDFWISPVRDGKVTVLAILDGPSLTGAYRFEASRTPSTTDVDCALFLRKDVARLGIAPMSSMFWHGKPLRWDGDDLRLEVHDSDGMLVVGGRGERVFRPLANPPGVCVATFTEEDPRAFGLIQRERRLAYYDDPVGFGARPNLVVVPKGRWGKGAVQLVQIHGRREYDDNVVCQWVPERQAKAGDEVRMAYRLLWSTTEPMPDGLARATGTRLSLGETRKEAAMPQGDFEVWRSFVVDFEGANLAAEDLQVATPVLSLSKGRMNRLSIRRAPDRRKDWWRVWFEVGTDDGAPVECRLFLQAEDGRPLSETWSYLFFPLQMWKGLDLQSKAPSEERMPTGPSSTADATPLVDDSSAADGDGPTFRTPPFGRNGPLVGDLVDR